MARVLFVCLALCIAYACAMKTPMPTSVDVDDVTFQKFWAFQKQYNKQYASLAEFQDRLVKFSASVARIEARNAAQKGENIFAVNKFSDLSPEEFKSMYLGFRPHAPLNTTVKMSTLSDVPTTVDWRTKGAVTPVKDQGQCGSCWAFSATEETESMWFLAGNSLPVLAPQQIVSCDNVDQGCNGGDTPTAYAYIKQAGGLVAEKDDPYTSGDTGDDGTCPSKLNPIAQVKGFTYATKPCTDSCTSQDEDTLAANLASTGPVSICVYAESWQDYSSGVLKSDCPSAYDQLDHCVQLVGYDKTGSTPYWIVRNSWNTNWGLDGYIHIAMGSNLCGVADEATIVTV
jgi:C1A family cysteine protease